MGTKPSLDIKVRQRVAAHLRRLRYERDFPSDAAMAEFIGVSRSAMNRILKTERTAGLDFLLLVRERLKVSLDHLVADDPDPEWLDPSYVPPPLPRSRR